MFEKGVFAKFTACMYQSRVILIQWFTNNCGPNIFIVDRIQENIFLKRIYSKCSSVHKNILSLENTIGKKNYSNVWLILNPDEPNHEFTFVFCISIVIMYVRWQDIIVLLLCIHHKFT